MDSGLRNVIVVVVVEQEVLEEVFFSKSKLRVLVVGSSTLYSGHVVVCGFYRSGRV